MSLMRALWNDESGFIVSAELVLIATVVLLGLIVGLATLRDDIIGEVADIGDAFAELNQSYSYAGITGHSSSVNGGLFTDVADFGQQPGGDQVAGNFVFCVAITPGVGE